MFTFFLKTNMYRLMLMQLCILWIAQGQTTIRKVQLKHLIQGLVAMKSHKLFNRDESFKSEAELFYPNTIWGQSYKTFYTSGGCKIKCLNCWFNEKEKCNRKNMLGCSVLTLWWTKVCRIALFTCFRTCL